MGFRIRVKFTDGTDADFDVSIVEIDTVTPVAIAANGAYSIVIMDDPENHPRIEQL